MQWDSLSAIELLYTSAAKSNYTIAIAHFLTIIAAYLQLEEKLWYCNTYKISHELDNSENIRHICLSFDKALETFDVKFIKQNISGNVIDKQNLKNQIKAF